MTWRHAAMLALDLLISALVILPTMAFGALAAVVTQRRTGTAGPATFMVGEIGVVYVGGGTWRVGFLDAEGSVNTFREFVDCSGPNARKHADRHAEAMRRRCSRQGAA